MGEPRIAIPEAPGFWRQGKSVVFKYRDDRRRQRWGRARNLTEAKKRRAALTTDVARGDYIEQSKETVPEYGRRWVETYQGRTKRAISEHTRSEYRERLEDAFAFFAGVRMSDVKPQDIKAFAAHVAKRTRRRKRKAADGRMLVDARPLSEASVRMALAPVKAMFATAWEEGLIRSNPTAGVRIVVPRKAVVDEDDGPVRALTPAQLQQFLAAVDDDWLLFFRVLVALGLRISEILELRWRDVDLGTRVVRIRRNFYDGEVGNLKTKHSRRDLKLNPELARALWALRKATKAKDGELVFTSARGQRVNSSNVASRVLKPAAGTVGAPWASFHTFRHTCASLLFNVYGWNPKQVQVWLGHHSPAFTLERYVHLLPADLPEPPTIAIVPSTVPAGTIAELDDVAAAAGAS